MTARTIIPFNKTAPTATGVIPPTDDGAARAGGSDRCAAVAAAPSRLAHDTEAVKRAADDYVRHAKLDAAKVAGGNAVREAAMIQQQGEALMLAGMRLLAGEGR
jgi:hypothetical protein